jgi:hypothetical protein
MDAYACLFDKNIEKWNNDNKQETIYRMGKK